MRELKAPCVQKHALQALFLKRFVPFEIAVFVISSDGVSLRSQVHSNLMSSPSLDGDLQQSASIPTLCHFDQGDRSHAIRIFIGRDPNSALAIRQQEFMQRAVDDLLFFWPLTLHQGQIGLARFALPELVLNML